MQTTPSDSQCGWLDALSAPERQCVRDMADTLERSARAGTPLQALRGKNLAVLCEDIACPRLGSFRRAANALGAQVTHVLPSEALGTSSRTPDALGQLLGRLYDAIDCHGLSPEVVERLKRITGKPVFNDLACHAHAEPGEAQAPDFTLQALLLVTLG